MPNICVQCAGASVTMPPGALTVDPATLLCYNILIAM